ncbi:hypothetical protein C1645_815154 [Glomus cerebriforme]|uniref:Uncharacterized protein n=1 Tax=Glomus cerebriforme TaxID=658196 RepID=A0A397TGY0_9GLOM|nr:hypothetical protein C1645_815154 [Glomus cerebriforme]
MVVKNESLVESIAPTKTTVAQDSATQSLFTTQFNSLPGNPDPAQVKIVYSTTIKHTGIKSTSTDSTSPDSNENFAMNRGNNMFNIALIITFIAAAVMFGG